MFEPFLQAPAIAQLIADEARSLNKHKRTPEQIEAIYSHGQDLLVSASAGSGKTFVMVERIVDMICRGVAIKELFISTFTVKAAGELKERLENKLKERIEQTSDQQQELLSHLSQQLADIQTADIGTMDAFTQKLVSQHGYLLGLSPKFRILTDKSEQDNLKKEVFDDLFEDYMSGKDKRVFQQLVRNFSGHSKDTTPFRQVVEQVFSFVQSTPNPKNWLTTRFLPPTSDAVPLLTAMRSQGLEVIAELDKFFSHHLAHEAQLFPKAKYLDHVQSILDRLAPIDLTADLTSIETALQFVADLAASSNGRALTNSTRKEDTKDIKEAYNKERKLLIEQVKEWTNRLFQTQLMLRYENQATPLLVLLQSFMLDFCDQYLQVKRAENSFEFADISHFAIQILQDFPDVRQAYQDRYVEVMVDEYQDTNHTQETMLDLLSRGNNRFMVGDIKQSIYRFRQADPQIFNSKFKQFQTDPSAGRLILLKENFRSQIEVLEATNAIFKRLMDDDLGDLVYDDSHQLVAGSSKQTLYQSQNTCEYLIYNTDNTTPEVEPDLVDEEETDKDTDKADGATVTQGEVELVAKEIIRLHQSGVPFKDITLLVPTRTRNDNILRTFERYGIPLKADGGELTYLTSVDVLVMLDTLRTINNPLKDYALVALLKSPMFDWTEDELTRIALQGKEISFYEKALLAIAEQGDLPHLITPELAEKLSYFQKYLKKWRTYAKSHRLYDLIWLIYQDRLYYDHVGFLPNGDKRQANLYALALRANQFEQTGFKGLGRFIGMIDRILQTGNDLANVEVAPAQDAVGLMTIHKSKGLQFAYVFLLNMDKRFNKLDETSKLILHRQHGAGMTYLADLKKEFEPEATKLPQVLVTMETTAYQNNRLLLRRASLSEQMRLLYVAMTRAEKKLYLVGKGSQDKLTDKFDGQLENGRLPLALRDQLNTFQDWVLAIAAADKDLPIRRRFVSDDDLAKDDVQLTSPSLPTALTNQAHLRQSDTIKKALEVLENVDQLNQTYRSAINLPTVRTPSQIKERYQPILDSQELDVMERTSQPVSFELPTFGEPVRVTPTALGSAIHDLMQRVTISQAVSRADLEAALNETAAPDKIKASIDLDKLYQFFATDLGQLIQQEEANLVREAPFALLKKDAKSGEDFIIRGIIDGFVKLPDRIVLFDYKTDKYRTPNSLISRYQDQMTLYAQALSQAYGIPKVDKYLVLLGGDKLDVVQLP